MVIEAEIQGSGIKGIRGIEMKGKIFGRSKVMMKMGMMMTWGRRSLGVIELFLGLLGLKVTLCCRML